MFETDADLLVEPFRDRSLYAGDPALDILDCLVVVHKTGSPQQRLRSLVVDDVEREWAWLPQTPCYGT